MEEYKPNSHKFKEGKTETAEDKNIEKVVRGSVKSRKKNEIRKFASFFMSDDTTDVKTYILMDVMVPAIKDIIADTVNTILYGGTSRNKKSGSASKTPYRSYYDSRNDRTTHNTRSRSEYDYDDIILDNLGEAEQVLAKMDELISVYGLVSVADFYDLVGVTGSYTDNKYGWTDLRNATAARVRGGGYLLKLPRAIPLN